MEASSLIFRFGSTGVEGVRGDMRQLSADQRGLQQDSQKTGGFLRGMFQTAGGLVVGGLFTAIGGGITGMVGGLINANANFEMLNKQLAFVTGSAEQAQSVYAKINELAIKSPYSEVDFGESAVLLQAYGLDATKWLEIIGDTSAVTGKTIMQTTNAVTDAANGQYRRLIEYGINATEANGQTIFEYIDKTGKRVTKSVDSTNKDLIASTVGAIMNDQYGGAMSAFADTWLGQVATLKDNIKARMRNATAGIFEQLGAVVRFANNIFAVGWRKAFTDAFGGGAVDIIDKFLRTLTATFGAIKSFSLGLIEAFRMGTRVKYLVADLPAPLRGIAQAIFTIADGLGDIFRKILQGDWRGALGELWDTLKNLAGSALDLGSIAIDGALAIGSKLWGYIKRFGSWLWGEIKAAWNNRIEIGTALVNGVLNLGGMLALYARGFGSWILAKLTALWNHRVDIGNAVVDAKLSLSGAIDFDVVVKSIGNGIVTGIKAATSLGSDIGGAVWDAIKSVNWVSLVTVDSFGAGSSFGTAIHDAIVAGVKAAIGLIKEISADDVKSLFTAIAAGIAAAALAAPTAMLAASTAILSFFAGAVKGVIIGDEDVDFTGIKNWFMGLPGKIKDWIGTVTGTLTQKGKDLIGGLYSAALGKWLEVVIWLIGLPGRAAIAIANGIISATDALKLNGVDILGTVKTGVENAWSILGAYIGGIPSLAASVLTNAATYAYNLLWDAGYALFLPVYDGAMWVWTNLIKPIIDAIPGWVPGFGTSSAGIGRTSGVSTARNQSLALRSGSVGGSAGGVTVNNFDLRGAIVGKDAEQWIRDKMNQASNNAVSRVRSNGLAGVVN